MPAKPACYQSLIKRKIGLLGGSFNPAHQGHIDISLNAVKAFNLDEIWWLVSPQNPLKSSSDMAGFTKRLHGAKSLTARHHPIKIHDFEARYRITHTYQTIRLLKRLYGYKSDFIFIIGSDNLLQLPQWHRWRDMAKQVNIAIAPRKAADLQARCGLIRQAYGKKCHFGHHFPKHALCAAPPSFFYLTAKRNPTSASLLRNTQPR